MQTVTENPKINKNLSRIWTALRDKQNSTEWIFEKIDNINCQIITTNYLQSQNADWIGNTPLHFAAFERNLEAFDVFLRHEADFTIKNNDGLTALHLVFQRSLKANSNYAVYKLDDPFVQSVLSAHLKNKKYDNPANSNGLSHFHIACVVNNVEVVTGFLDSGILIDHTVKMDSSLFPGYTSLHFATKYCAFEVVDLLLIHGADVHTKDAKGMTALHVSLERKLEIINDINANKTLRDTISKILLLLLSKVDNSNVATIDKWGLSNFHISCTLKSSKITKYFLKKVLNINDTINMDSPLWPGFSALHFAALCNLDSVKLLMKKGADINVKDAKGVTPFDMCIERYENRYIYKIISLNPIWKNIILSDDKTKLSELVFAMRCSNKFKIFLEKLSKNISICSDSLLWPGCSPMHIAVILAKKDSMANEESKQKNMRLRNLFDQNPSMLYSQDVRGRTPLHSAFQLNKKPVLDLLMDFLKECPNLVDYVDEDNLSLVHIASANNKTDLLKRLLSMGTYVDTIYKGKSQFSPVVHSGSTPLHFAVIYGSTEAAVVLIEHGANVYVKDVNDMTPIHLALMNTEIDIHEILTLLPNLKDSVVNGIGLSHLHVACWCEKLDTVQQLLNDGADVNLQITCQQTINAVDSNASSLLEHDGYSPLLFAYDRLDFESAELLLEHGADIFVETTKGVALLYVVLANYDAFVYDFLRTVRRNEALMARLQSETGMTSLHLACFDLDTNLIEKSLSEGENVNAQIPSFSPILRGYAPLHILLHSAYDCEADEIIEVMELLLKAGADVTLQNSNLETAICMAYGWCNHSKNENFFLDTLFKAQRDFSINPKSIEGISHFHIACHICNTSIAEKFLTYGDIDINQPIDYFCRNYYSRLAGITALHLAAGSRVELCGLAKQLDTVNLLLNHGADVEAEDCYGNTPFHKCARYSCLDVFERLARTGADVNIRNTEGETPLYDYFKSDKVSPEGIKALTRFGCRLNSFGSARGSGTMGRLLHVLSLVDLQNLLSALIVNFEQQMQADNLNRTVIHNIVSTQSPDITADQYAELIEQVSRAGCDIDDQDNLGRTALHVAVKFHNCKALFGLLLAGADVNIRDNNGQTALAYYDFNKYEECVNEYHQDEKKCEHLVTLQTLATHVKKLQLCGLDGNEQNEDLTSKAIKKLRTEAVLDQFLKELETAKSTKIEFHSLTLYDFLSEYGAVVDYPRMSETKRNDVIELFSPDGVQKVREEFPELAGILQLQYRKARVRSKLVELAKNALMDLTGFRLPEICSELILILLKNSELNHLIASTASIKDVK